MSNKTFDEKTEDEKLVSLRKMWKTIWEACILKLHGNEDWKEFRKKNGDNSSKVLGTGNQIPFKTSKTVRKHLSTLINKAKKLGVIESANIEKEEVIFKEKKQLLQVNILSDLPRISQLTEIIKKKRPKRIRILDTWMSNIEGQVDFLEEWTKYCHNIEILLLHPESQHTRLRFSTNDIDKEKKQLEHTTQAIKCMEELVNLQEKIFDKDINCNFKIHLYDDFPGLMAYIFDEKIYYGCYLSIKFSQHTFIHEFDKSERSSDVSEQIEKHFENLQKNATEGNLEQLKLIKDSFESREKGEFESRKKLIETLLSHGDEYILYNTDDPKYLNAYQRSRLKIDKDKGMCELYIADRERDHDEIKYLGEIKAIGSNNLLFRFRRKDFFLSFLVFVNTVTDREVFLGMYLHADQRDRPVSGNALLISIKTLGEDKYHPTSSTLALWKKYKFFEIF